MSVRSVSVLPAERRRAREFAELLEGSRQVTGHELESLVALTTTLQPAPFAPRADFRTTLRESLVAQAAAREVLAPARVDPPRRQHRARTAVAGLVAVSLVGGVGAAVASTHALPGDALYGLKRGIESAQLKFTHSDLSRGRELLDQADHRLSEAEDLAASEEARTPSTSARIATAIADLNTATQAGVKAFEAAYAGSGDGATLVELNRFVVDQSARLADLSDLLSPALRGLLGPLRTQLAALARQLSTLIVAPSAPIAPGAVATDTLDGLTGGATSGTGAGVGNGGAATLPSAVPRVSLPAPPVPSIPVPTAPAPSITAPSVPAPSVPAPSVSVPNVSVPPIGTPTLPVAPPTCVAVPPLTSC